MKLSKVEAVVAEMNDEKRIVDACIMRLEVAGGAGRQVLDDYSVTLGACIARLTGTGSEPAPAKRTRKPRKASEPTL